jgi:hypothetical protein
MWSCGIHSIHSVRSSVSVMEDYIELWANNSLNVQKNMDGGGEGYSFNASPDYSKEQACSCGI